MEQTNEKMACAIDLNQKVFFVVTGASRGIGKTMAIECARKFKAGSCVALLARTASGLDDTKAEILHENPNIRVATHSIDLTTPTPEALRKCLTDSLDASVDISGFDLAFIIHNVGTLGDVTKFARDLNDRNVWREYYDTNLFSIAILNSVFIDFAGNVKKFIVNITSKSAVEPFRSAALYSSGKAAREMFFRTLALENDDITVLNYSTGPVDTEMTRNMAMASISPEMREKMTRMRETKTILTTHQTTEKFLKVITNGAYKSGDRVDYFSA